MRLDGAKTRRLQCPDRVHGAVKASSLGKRGYELVTMNLDGSNRRQITDNDQQEFPRPAISAGDTRK